jgi:hypothetical protein
MDEIKYKVYIDIDLNGNVIKIFSSAFSTPSGNSILIDEGTGDKYRHAQNCYLDKPLINKNMSYNYLYDGTKIIDKRI